MSTEAGRGTLALAGAANLVGGALGAGINLVLAALVGRHLGAEGAGAYFLVVAAFLIASNTAELGADTGLVRFVAAARALGTGGDVPRLVRTAVRPVLVVGTVLVVVGLVLVLVAPPVADVSPALLAVAVPLVLLSSLTALALSITRGLGDPLGFPLVQNLLLPAGRVAGVGVAVAAGCSVSGVLAGWLAPVPVALAVAVVLAVRHLRRATAQPASAAPDLERTFWSFSAVRGVTACVEILLEWVDVILVGALASPAEAGVYAVVTRCVRVGEVVQQAARIAVGPVVSAALARGDLPLAGRVHGLVGAAMVWAAWPFFALLAVFAEGVLSFFGPGFASGATALQVLAAAMAVSTAAGAVQTVLLMGGRSSWQLADKGGALALNVVLNLLLVPPYGLEGAAVAWAVTIVADTAVVVWQVARPMGVRAPRRPLAVAAALGVGVVLVPALLARETWGPSLGVLVPTALVLGVVHVALGAALRRPLGLVELAALRSS